MVFHFHLGNQTAQTSNHIVAWQGFLNSDLSACIKLIIRAAIRASILMFHFGVTCVEFSFENYGQHSLCIHQTPPFILIIFFIRSTAVPTEVGIGVAATSPPPEKIAARVPSIKASVSCSNSCSRFQKCVRMG